ncbi:MAG: tripartite tricarboxylate transporter substrate binding protein [Proteobacteria bacterium]|nr:tripartite tricarboxylate transporter substrate binding protein [Burkholderiales bacterium]
MRRLLGCCVLCLLGATCFAQGWPSRPMRLVIPFAPGGGADIAGRLIAQELSEALKQTVLVENRAGAGGTLALDHVAKSPADGYSIALGHLGGIAIAPFLYKTLPFDPIRDLVPVTLAVNGLSVLVVNPALPVKTVAELIAYAKANPNKLSFGSAGSGTDTHLAGELFRTLTGTTMIHIPYKGGAPAMLDLIAGRTQLSFASVATAISYVQADKLRAIAMTGSRRFDGLPGVPTIAESGVPGYEINNWYGLFVPAGTPQDIVTRLNAATVRAVQNPELRARLTAAGLEPVWNTPSEFAAYVRSETAKWGKIVTESGATAN